MLRLIIFDLDGTLVDSSQDLTNAVNTAIAPHGLEKLTAEKTKNLVGEGVSRLIEKVLGPEGMHLHETVLESFLTCYAEHLADCTRPYPGAAETLRELAPFRKAVISNKRAALTQAVLGQLGLISHFDLVFGSDSTEAMKPSPLPLLRAMELLSCSPAETLVVGDSRYDIEAGRAAGAAVCAVTYGYGAAALLKGADHYIGSLNELPQLIRTEFGHGNDF